MILKNDARATLDYHSCANSLCRNYYTVFLCSFPALRHSKVETYFQLDFGLVFWSVFNSYFDEDVNMTLFYRIVFYFKVWNSLLNFVASSNLSHEVPFCHHGVPMRLPATANLGSYANKAKGRMRRNEIASSEQEYQLVVIQAFFLVDIEDEWLVPARIWGPPSRFGLFFVSHVSLVQKLYFHVRFWNLFGMFWC